MDRLILAIASACCFANVIAIDDLRKKLQIQEMLIEVLKCKVIEEQKKVIELQKKVER